MLWAPPLTHETRFLHKNWFFSFGTVEAYILQSARPVAQKSCIFTYMTAIGSGVWQTPTMRRNPSLIYVAEGPPRCRAKAGCAKYALRFVSESLPLWDSMDMSPCCRATAAWVILQICEGLAFCASESSPWWNTRIATAARP